VINNILCYVTIISKQIVELIYSLTNPCIDVFLFLLLFKHMAITNWTVPIWVSITCLVHLQVVLDKSISRQNASKHCIQLFHIGQHLQPMVHFQKVCQCPINIVLLCVLYIFLRFSVFGMLGVFSFHTFLCYYLYWCYFWNYY